MFTKMVPDTPNINGVGRKFHADTKCLNALLLEVDESIVTSIRKEVNEAFRVSPAMQRIDVERSEQKAKHGFDDSHDDEHDGGELSLASSAIISNDFANWPWDFPTFDHISKKKKSHRMIIAGALAKAELERIERYLTVQLSLEE